MKKATRNHSRITISTVDSTILLEQHESCIRMKCNQMMVTIDITTFKAIVEFKNSEASVSRSKSKCRYCGSTLQSASLHASVCGSEDCQILASLGCKKSHKCGHYCGGVVDETECLPCLQGCDRDALVALKISQDHEDQCMICFTSSLGEEPSVKLQCGHVFHFQCSTRLLQSRWNGPRITFGFAQCPICKSSMLRDRNPCLQQYLEPIESLYAEVRRKALMRLDYDGLASTAGKSEEERALFAIAKYAYYTCFRCKKAYFGGDAACDVARGSADFNPEELICGACVGGLTILLQG
jgi:E3 ubiquitin-protein ligase MYCBP2